MLITYNKSTTLKDIKAFICVPGAGKTHLAMNNPKYIDIDRIRSNYTHNRPQNFSVEEHEKIKGRKTNSKIKEHKKNALPFIKETINSSLQDNKIILSAPSPEIVEYINELNIPYALVYFKIEDNDLIKKRLYNRGNQKLFVEKNCEISIAKKYYKENINDKRPYIKIELTGQEYLTDIHQLI